MKSSAAAQPQTRPAPDVITDDFLAMLRAHGVVEAYLFGSMTDGTAGPESDVDLLVTFDRPASLFDELRLADRLRELCGRPVDLMTELLPAFAPYIRPTLVLLPL